MTQILIPRNGINQTNSGILEILTDKALPEGKSIAIRNNGDFIGHAERISQRHFWYNPYLGTTGIKSFTASIVDENNLNLNVVESNPYIVGYGDVYTLYGDQGNNFPEVFGSGLPGNYVRGYAAGIFKLGADLTDLANLQDSDIMCGSVFIGSINGGGTGKIVVNGVAVQTFVLNSLSLVDRVAMYSETWFNDDPALLQGLTGYVDNIELSVQGQYIYVDSSPPTTVLSFDTKNTKYAWFVDEVTGAGEGVLVPGYSVNTRPISMFTSPLLTNTPQFQWDSLPSGEVNPNISYYDKVAETQLNVNLGGYAPCWTSSDPEASNSTFGVYYDLGYLDNINSSIELDGGWQESPSLVNTGVTYYYTLTDPAAIAAYTILDQTRASPVAIAGLRSYPGIASISAWQGGSLIQAVHYGKPLLFEMWYSKII
jgi:hypothetical protein